MYRHFEREKDEREKKSRLLLCFYIPIFFYDASDLPTNPPPSCRLLHFCFFSLHMVISVLSVVPHVWDGVCKEKEREGSMSICLLPFYCHGMREKNGWMMF